MKKIILSLALLSLGLLFAIDVHENAGSYGFKFLQNPTNPVSMALAGRGSNSLSNPSGFVNQPATQVHYAHSVLSASRAHWFAETYFTNVSYSHADRSKHFGLILRSMDYGDLEKRDESGELIGSYSPIDLNLMANYALRLNPSSYFGINAGLIYEKLNTASSYGVNGDLGYTWLPPLKDSRISISLRNMGISSKMNKERIDLPLTLEAELSKDIRLGENCLSLGTFAIKAADEDTKGGVYSEFTLYDIISLRAGYKFNYAAEDLSAGVGINVKGIGVDYAWASYQNQLDDVHYFGISYKF